MLVDLLDEAAGAPDRVALVSRERSWTHAELDLVVTERADRLRADGTREGHVVPITVDASAETVIRLLALWRAGATPAPLNDKLTAPERSAAVRALAHERSEAQAVLWTSGTEGTPRGVAISFRNLAASAMGARSALGLGPDDVWLASLSPAHIGGLALVTRALLLGSKLVATGPFDPAQALALLDGDGPVAHGQAVVTHLSVVPTQLLRMMDLRGDAPPPATLRCVLVGGARAPEGLVRRALEAGWPLALTYGLTEATSQVATAPPELTRRKPGTVGRALQGVQVRVGEGGELLVRGPTVASGYVGLEGGVIAPDGWLHTGDIGHLDDDGDLWVTGRRSDRIVTGGVTVDAVEVEEALRSHSRVADACVVGVPDSEWGERVCAWVVPLGDEEVARALRGGLSGELGEFLRERLSTPKLPRVFHVSEKLPRNANGKVDRSAVRAVMSDVSSTGEGTAQRSELR